MAWQRLAGSDARVGPVSGSSVDILLTPAADVTLWWRGLAAAADGAFAMTGDGRIVLWNVAATRITEYEAAEALGRCCCYVLLARDVQRDRVCSASCRLLGQIKDGESVATFDLQTTSKSGRRIWLNMSTVVLAVSDAKAPRWIHLFRDVTAVKGVLGLIQHRLARPPATDDP